MDTGLARAVLDREIADTSRPLENIMFLELVRRGYRIRVGSFRDREVRSLKAIDDNYPKTVLSLDTVVRDLPDGLIHRNVIEWLLDDGTE